MTDRTIFWKQISVGDRVGTIRFGTNSQNFAVVALGVSCRTLSVPRLAVFALVDRRKAFRVIERIGVVTGAYVQVAIGTELHGARMVTALSTLFFVFEQPLFTGEVEPVVAKIKTTDVLPRKIGRRILQINPAVLFKVRIEFEANQAVLLSRGDF